MTSPHPSDSAELLDRLQRGLGPAYRIERELGGGGMARIFVATDTNLGRQIVLKALSPELAASISADRFRREVRLAASLQHPHIVPLHAAGEADGVLYYTMPFVTGESLRQRLEREGPLPVAEAVRLLREVADALGFAHRQAIVHRDLKPANILLSEGHALVADFGIAKAVAASATAADTSSHTATGLVLGTPTYMAPEQASSDQSADHRADLYALGCLGYELLAGRPPFQATSVRALLTAHLIEPPVPVTAHRPDVPPALASLIMGLLAKDPAKRPQTAADVVDALETGEHDLRPQGVGRTSRRRPMVFASGALAALVIGTGLVLWSAGSRSSTPGHGVQRIALLPLANTTGDSSQAFVADGLTREVISALTSSGVRVIGYASASHYPPGSPLRKVAKELRVDAVALGALRRTAPRLQVVLELTDPASGENLWAETYTVDTSDLSVVATRAAQALAGVVRGQSPHAVESPYAGSPPRRPPNRAAYAEFLLGRQSAGGWTPEAYRRTVDHYTRAIALDSAFAAAWGALAGAHARYATNFDWVPRQAYDSARAEAARALSLNPAVGEAHLALALLKQARDWDWVGAEREFQRAIALEPSSTVHDDYAWFLVGMGRFQEAVAMDEKAVEIDPTEALFHASLSAALREAGHPGRGVEEARTAVNLDSTHAEGWLSLAWSLAQVERVEEASAAFDRYEALFGSDRPLERAVLYAHAGKDREARTLLNREAARGSREFATDFFDVAKAYSLLGEKERALGLLQGATDRREFWWPSLTVWDPIRKEPRFRELVNRMGMPEAAD